MPKVTYTPLENGDPIETEFAGIKFRAGEPVEVGDAKVLQSFRVTKETPDGEVRGKAEDRYCSVAEVLSGNPYFNVEGVAQVQKAKGGRPRLPKTPEEYKGYALEWFARMGTPSELGSRWEAEEGLREKLGVHDEGEIVSYLRPFYEARFQELKKAVA